MILLCNFVAQAPASAGVSPPSSASAATGAATTEDTRIVSGVNASRRLTVVTNILPYDTALVVYLGKNGQTYRPHSAGAGYVSNLYAGQSIIKLELSVSHLGHTFSTLAHTSGRLRLVRTNIARAQAQGGACKSSYFQALLDAVVSSPWDGLGARTISAISGGTGVLASASDLTFRIGGEYRLCYSEDGTFDQADVLNVTMQVKGVSQTVTSCSTGDCLYLKKNYCYSLKDKYNNVGNTMTGSTSCLPALGNLFVGNTGKGSWSSVFTTTYSGQSSSTASTSVAVASVTAQACTTSPAAFIGPPASPGCTNGGVIFVSTGSSGSDVTIPLPPTRNDLGVCANLGGFRAYTVAACYCPDYDGCNSPTDFVQQVGIVYYYATKTCGHGYDALQCSPDYTGPSAPFRFALQVSCPSDACKETGSRIKIVAKNANNDLPAWSVNNGCFAAVHGQNSLGRDVLPTGVNVDVVTFDGGPRLDFKLWNLKLVPELVSNDTLQGVGGWPTGGLAVFLTYNLDTIDNCTNVTNSLNGTNCTTITTSTTLIPTTVTTTTTTLDKAMETAGFLFVMGTTLPESRNFAQDETFDVCFCNTACSQPRNWFKAGEVRATPVQLVSAATNTTGDAKLLVVQYVNQPGIVGFYRPQNASNQLGMQDGGMVKIVQDNDMAIDDVTCKSSSFDETLVNTSLGPYSNFRAANSFQGIVSLADDANRLIFNGGQLQQNQITLKRAGVIAICYCPKIDGLTCTRNNWVLASRLLVRGPTPGQSWMFTTHVVFRFSFTGFGLTTSDTIRIIPNTSSCDDNKGRPNGETPLTGIKLQCPAPCVDVGTALQPINRDISFDLLADDRYLCDLQNTNCRTCDIRSVTVLNSTHTEIQFTAVPGLVDGDLLTLGSNIICDSTDPYCTPDALTNLKGQYQFVDSSQNNPAAPDTYIAGHAVRSSPTSQQAFLIPVGWPSPVPKFQVVIQASNNNKQGRWTRHSRGITKEEVKGTKEQYNMKVCWKYGGTLGSYVGEVGTLSLRNPSSMARCLISMTGTVARMSLPVVVSFRTSSPTTAPRYATVEGATQLRLLWTNVNAMTPRYVDGLALQTSTFTDEVSEAKQYICGSIFKEMWSSDTELGFPLPLGCYHRSFGTMIEISLVFERKSGLRAGYDYQLVLNAMAQDSAQQFGHYAEIMVMDDTVTKPYEAIERGQAYLNNLPQSAAAGTAGVMFIAPEGFKIINGDITGLYEMTTNRPLTFELRGDALGGGIKANSFLRVFLSPMTQWSLAVQCAALCTSNNEAITPCGSVRTCTGEPIVQDFSKSMLKLELPSTMTTVVDPDYVTIRVDQLVMPLGGFFPTKVGAQLTMPTTDARPHYMMSTGAILWKAPDPGQTYGRLVDITGDGNSKPFRSDTLNVLYARVVLGAILHAQVQHGDASLTITLPAGYECLRLQDFPGPGITKISPWAAEETLNVFGTTIPQGRGTPDEGAGTRGWSVTQNNCTWTLRQNAVIYANSSLYFRLNVNNPSFAMKREDTRNKWYISIRGKGVHHTHVDFPPVLFTNFGTNFAKNKALLGLMDYTYITPWNFVQSNSAGATSQLYIFFRTEQFNNVNGYVQIRGPSGFYFGTNGAYCNASDLPNSYYKRFATGTMSYQGWDTSRLPGIVSCTHSTTPNNVAAVQLEGMLLAGRWYAFALSIRNLVAYTSAQQDQWKIFTLTQAQYNVDGTRYPVMMVPDASGNGSNASSKSFGLFLYQLNDTGVFVTNMKPYINTGLAAYVTVKPLKLPYTVNTTLRIIAPEGFIWDFTNAQYRRFPNDGLQGVHCISAAMPGGMPTMANNVLRWATPSLYLSSETYGFTGMARIPARTSTSSINAFIIEFGYDSTNASGRIAATTVMSKLDPGRANIETNASHLIFQMTVGDIFPGGRITINGSKPREHDVALDCTKNLTATIPVRGCANESTGTPGVWPKMFQPPPHVICKTDRSTAQSLVIDIYAVGAHIPPGMYRFQISLKPKPSSGGGGRRLQSSAVAPLSVKSNSPCGLDRCWTFRTASNNVITTGTLFGPINVLERLKSFSEVGALTDVSVDYSTNAQGLQNNWTVTFRIITAIPVGGGILITGPDHFNVNATCSLMKPAGVRGSPYYVWSMKGAVHTLPSDVKCTANRIAPVTSGGGAPSTGTMKLFLTVGRSGLPPGLYQFNLLEVRNPSQRITNPAKVTTSCGFRECWDFKSVENFSQTPYVELDVPWAIPVAPVNDHMRFANFSVVSTSRDDRPLRPNVLVFEFNLMQGAVFPSYFKIRAPLGFVFKEECMTDIVTNGSLIFGGSLPSGYTDWSTDAVITSCRAEGPDMQFYVDPGLTMGLPANRLIAVQISVLWNPAFPPIANTWSIEYAEESYLPIIGFPLTQFSRTSMYAISWARVGGTPKFENPVTFTFRPLSSVRGTGTKIVLQAPPWFQMTHVRFECSIILQKLNVAATTGKAPPMNFTDISSLLSKPFVRWGESEYSCTVDQYNLRKLTVEVLSNSIELLEGQDYQLTVYLNNPPTQVVGATWGVNYDWVVISSMWSLQTEAGPLARSPSFRDLSYIEGANILEVIYPFSVQWLNPSTSAYNDVSSGKALLTGVQFVIGVTKHVSPNELVDIQAPYGFNLSANATVPAWQLFLSNTVVDTDTAPGPCETVTWAPAADIYIHDLNKKGFDGAFTDGTYGYAVPFRNGPNHFGQIARFLLNPPQWGNAANFQILDLAQVKAQLKGFKGGFTDGTYGYLVPCEKLDGPHGFVPRFRLSNFHSSSVEWLDVTVKDPYMRGFRYGFINGSQGYLVPHYNGTVYFGKVVKFDLISFDAGSIEVFNLALFNPELIGFSGGFTDGVYGYLAPFKRNYTYYWGKVVRFSLDFSLQSVSVLDLTTVHPDLRGFSGAFTDGTYGYLVPDRIELNKPHGRVARFTLSTFDQVEMLDLTLTDPGLKGFITGFTDDDQKYAYLVPSQNDGGYSGKMARFRLNLAAGVPFSQSPVEMLDLSNPSHTDTFSTELKGFGGGFSSGNYIYTVPFGNAGNLGLMTGFTWEDYSKNLLINCTGRRMSIGIGTTGLIALRPPRMIFRMNMVAAAKELHVAENNWVVRHYGSSTSGPGTAGVIAENAQRGWKIRPDLENVMVNLTGQYQAASASSDIEIAFTPMSDAGEVVIKARKPSGFNFKTAIAVSLGHEVIRDLSNLWPPDECRVRAELFAGLPVIVRLSQLTLGTGGGHTEFDINTKLSNGIVADERLSFKSGFRLPGRITVLSKSIQNQFQKNSTKYPVTSLWTVRMSESAEVKFRVRFSQPVLNGTLFRIRAPPYAMHSVTLANDTNATHPIDAPVFSVAHAEVTLRLNQTVPSNKDIYIIIPVLTPSVADPQDSLWSFVVFDNDPLPVNTNDGLTQGFQLVAPIGFQLSALRAPPLSEIAVTLTIDPKGCKPTELVLVAPETFNFSTNCLKSGSHTSVSSCAPAGRIGSREAAKLKLSQEATQILTPVILKVLTPRISSSDTRWYLQARNTQFNTERGWAEYIQGIQVSPMPNSGVVYSGVYSVPLTVMVVRFQTTIRTVANSKIRVLYPAGLHGVECTDPGTFQKISLPSDATCQEYGQAVPDKYVEITLPTPLDIGSQAFAIRVTPTMFTPIPNLFSILVYEPVNNNVEDGAIDLPGMKSERFLRVQAAPLIWGHCEGTKICQVSMGFDLIEDIPASKNKEIFEIVIRPPPLFELQVTDIAQIQTALPLRTPALEHFTTFFRLKVKPQAQTAGQPQLALGVYRIQFPVKAPFRTPDSNVWLMVLCGVGNSTCSDEHSPRAITSLPLEGWQIGAQHPTGLVGQTSSAMHSINLKNCQVAGVLLICSWLLSFARSA